ncbi:MAG: caspase family protein, partial [Elusimicrobia bacterium]|nr:caspase family protein [Elusimicrobiota bacterium]
GKVVAFTASAGNQISGSFEEQGHGLFTYYFLKGLNGAAADGSGKVTVKSLYTYIKPVVEDEANRENRNQTPQLMPEASEAITLR